MKYFIDTEFAEEPCRIELISLAIVAEDGREFYAESSDFKDEIANDWVKKNVLPKLWHRQTDKSKYNVWIRDGGVGGLMKKQEIGGAVRRFIACDKPEFWGWFADYDWVVFCWLFGAMVDLPKGWPMYCRDIKQWADQLGGIPLPDQTSDEHHALLDARWNKKAFEYLQKGKELTCPECGAYAYIESHSPASDHPECSTDRLQCEVCDWHSDEWPSAGGDLE